MAMAAISIGASGMGAAEAQLNAVASNVANVADVGATPGSGLPDTVYEPIDVVDVASGTGTQPSGVGYSAMPNANAYFQAYDPTSPAADSAGMVAMPQVDLADQMVKLAAAKTLFSASAKVISAGDSMQQTAIDMLA